MTPADIPAVAANLLCFVSIAIYAERRLNTPPSNRSSTRLRLYRQAVLGYVVCTLILFVVLSSALQYQAMDRLLLTLDLADKPYLDSIAKLPAPLLATVLLTVWLPNVPLVREVDAWLLDAFKSRANIPQEIRDRAERLTPQNFLVTANDIAGLEALIDAEGLPDELTGHLRPSKGEGLDLSRYRLTRVLKLFRETRNLARKPDCERFFDDFSDQWGPAQQNFRTFCQQAAAALEQARKLREQVSPAEYEEQVADKREQFRVSCAAMFGTLALFAAGAVLAKDATEHGIGERMRSIGFAVEDEPEKPEFPLRGLAGLALLLLLYLVVADLVIHRLHPFPHQPDLRSPVDASARPVFLLANYAVTIALTVWLVEQHPFLQRAAYDRARWDVYVLCSATGAATVSLIWLGCFLLRYGELPQSASEWSQAIAVAILVGSLSGAVAFCCDNDERRWPDSPWLQLAEGVGCLAFTALVGGILLMELDLPVGKEAARSTISAVILVLFPPSVSFIVGSLVPHICRMERKRARWRSEAPSREPGLPPANTAPLAPAQ